MLVRINGGNSGIREYLEYGIKQGREFSRSELDERVVLDGDLAITDAVINQIENRGQERYLHITISFREHDVDLTTLSAITDEYKNLFMAAYKKDEYNFYAEAHLPKNQTIIDKKNNKLIERKPHIHIIIPKMNLLTEKAMNPSGMINKHAKNLDAIQEHINKKYNLESPKSFIREGDNYYADIISRIKGDIYNKNGSDVKKSLIESIENDNIRDFSEFKKTVSLIGEMKIRNQGKENEYLSVKIDKDARFTNLKSPIFSKSYIESRQLMSLMPTDKQINERLSKWTSTISKEIKFIHSASPLFRKEYYSASRDDQKKLLTEKEIKYEQRYRGGEHKGKTRRQGNNQSRINDFGRKNIAGYTYGLSGLPKRGLVYGIRGKELHSKQTERILPLDEQRIMANERREKPEHSGLRRARHHEREGGGRLIVSNLPEQTLKTARSLNAQEDEKKHFLEIRQHLKPERLLAVLKDQYGLMPENHAVTFAKNGSARINAGKVNLNVSDFLTKYMSFPWNEAKEVLKNCYAEQKLDERLLKTDRLIRREVQILRTESWTQYKEDKNIIWKQRLPPPDRQAALTIAIFERLKREELIREQTQVKLNNNKIQQKEGKSMGLSDAFKGNVNAEVDSFVSTSAVISVKENMAKIQREQEILEQLSKRLRLNDLLAHKKPEGQVEYKSKDDGKTVFKDTGDRIIFTKDQQKGENIALGLEVAMAKYGHTLKLTGSDDFKEKAIQIAAERGLMVVFTPEKYQEALKQERDRIEQEKTSFLEKKSSILEEVKVSEKASDVQKKGMKM